MLWGTSLLAPGQSEPEVLCIKSLWHVALHYALVCLSLFDRPELIGNSVGKCLQNFVKEKRCINPQAKWWMNQLKHGWPFTDQSLTGKTVQKECVIGKGDCLWRWFHFHGKTTIHNPQHLTWKQHGLMFWGTTHCCQQTSCCQHFVQSSCGLVTQFLTGFFALSKKTKLSPAHRLDSPVSGLVCCGRTNSDVKRISHCIELGKKQEKYIARVSMECENGILQEKLPCTIDEPVAFDSCKS